MKDLPADQRPKVQRPNKTSKVIYKRPFISYACSRFLKPALLKLSQNPENRFQKAAAPKPPSLLQLPAADDRTTLKDLSDCTSLIWASMPSVHSSNIFS